MFSRRSKGTYTIGTRPEAELAMYGGLVGGDGAHTTVPSSETCEEVEFKKTNGNH